VIKHLTILLSVVTLAFIIHSCARESAPIGGKKDVTPPTILKSTPPNGSPQFTGNKFELKFSEFVVLNKINEQLLISPPVKETPDFKLKGKSLIVKFKEELKPNTTYSVYFGDAIQDLTEGNPIHSYSYIFSTGDFVDSLSMKGRIVDAFNLQPTDGIMVMLYRDNNDTISLDSMPLSVPPYYLSKTDKKGSFHFIGLADDDYLVFALKDQNSNYIFDQPSEEIAFIDSLVHPSYQEPIEVDTTVINDHSPIEIDSVINLRPDSLLIDTTQQNSSDITTIDMFLFQQADTVQRLMEAKLIRRNTIRFIFTNPADEVSINAENYPQRDQWHLSNWSKEHDTLWWFLHEPDLTVDTLNLLVKYHGDTLDNLFISTKLREKRVAPRNKKKEEKTKKKKNLLKYITNMKGGISPVSKLYIEFEQPIQTVIPDSVLFIAGEDSVYGSRFIALDSLHLKYSFPAELTEGTKYQLEIPDSSFIDWNGYFNKAATLKFSAKNIKEYGTLTVNLQPDHSGKYIFQLLNKKEEIIRQHQFTSDTTYFMEYLKPGNYLLKVIFDNNNNGKWDPGVYVHKTTPEAVTYFEKAVSIRANWEIEESFSFTNYDRNPPPGKKRK